MAGIGFELKKLFSKKGLFAMIRAYGYAGVVCAGPMLLGMAMLIGIRIVGQLAGMEEHQQELLNAMVTYTLLASLMTTNVLSMITTRYVADAIYVEEEERVLPSFYGSITLMQIIGGSLYASFLFFSGVPTIYKLCCLMFYMELVVVWTQIQYLTAVKDYRGIIKTFFMAVICALAAGYLFSRSGKNVLVAMLTAVICAYGFMMVWYYRLLTDYFPEGKGCAFSFLSWIDKYPQLVGVGVCSGIGLYAHLIIMWASPIGRQIEGLFYAAPGYDVPALFAFISILVTTINFVTSVEVNFYPKYQIYFGLFNHGGALADINRAEEELISTLEKELSYTFAKQFFTSVIFVIAGTLFIPRLPFGFTEEMLGIYRVLCVGYAFYAAANCVMLMTLYFADNVGALISSLTYAVTGVAATIIILQQDSRFYGFGFLIAGICYALVALLRLMWYTRKLSYYVMSRQPLVLEESKGVMTRLSEKLEKRYQMKRQKNKE